MGVATYPYLYIRCDMATVWPDVWLLRSWQLCCLLYTRRQVCLEYIVEIVNNISLYHCYH